MKLTIICTGDIHLGRCASRIPPGRDVNRFSATAAWADIVQRAIDEHADFVALTGDLVDRDSRYYEAYGPLESGLRRLAEAGIHTYAVSGNHDFDVLPRLVDSVGAERFHLLGRDGKWEQSEFQRNGQTICHIQGWSFPRLHFPDNPLRTYDLLATSDIPTIGMLHTELNNVNGKYAPTPAAELHAKPVLVWLIGHVHKPDWRQPELGAAILNPGSPLALDPGETGQHGPWKIVVENNKVHAEQLAMSRVRYESLSINSLANIRTEAELASTIPQLLRGHLTAIVDEADYLVYVAFRLTLTGTCPLHRTLEINLDKLAAELEFTQGNVTARVESFTVNTRPALDVEGLARGSDLAAALARLVQGLNNPPPNVDTQLLLRQLQGKLAAVYSAAGYRKIAEDVLPDEAAMLDLLRREGASLLDQLVSQKGDGMA